MKPFDDFPHSGTALLGRPRSGGSCRTGYGLSIQHMTGQSACAYCGVDLTSDYYRWLLMNIDHVVPAAEARLLGIPEDFFEDAINKVLACSGCNGFLNRYKPVASRLSVWTLEQFVALRDRSFEERTRLIADRRRIEVEIFESRPWESPIPPATSAFRGRAQAEVLPLVAVKEVELFIDNDEGYLSWLDSHPTGYVLNTTRVPTANYLMLHKATCGYVVGTPSRGVRWTTDFCKACSHDVSALQEWATLNADGSLKPCGRCKATT